MDKSDKSEAWQRGYEARSRCSARTTSTRPSRSADDFTRDLQHYVTEHAWGASWARPGLDFKTRSMLNLAMLTALNRPHEFEIHLRGALRNGVTRDEIKEILLQTAVYCGAPAALDSLQDREAGLGGASKEQGYHDMGEIIRTPSTHGRGRSTYRALVCRRLTTICPAWS